MTAIYLPSSYKLIWNYFSNCKRTLRIACFISSHGYGHATRCLAVMDALSQKFQPLEISIFSSLPNSFLEQNLNSSKFTSHNTKTDIGLIQKTPFEHDLTQTVLEWDQFLNFKSSENQKITESVKEINPDFILCDISPLGIKLGKRLKIPTVLIENFTWDWIYQTYVDAEPKFLPIIENLKEIFSYPDLRIQTNPICERLSDHPLVNPIFRMPRGSISETKRKMGINENDQVILVTTGGISQDFQFIQKLEQFPHYHFIVSGDQPRAKSYQNIFPLPHNSPIYFPDIVNISSVIVGKAGYGTVAEAWGNNKAFIRVFRHEFRESPYLKTFVDSHVPGEEIDLDHFLSGDWLHNLDNQSFQNSGTSDTQKDLNGATQVAELISDWIN